MPEQQRALSQGRLALQQQGVRGIDAALLQQKQANQLNKQLAMDAEKIALQQSLADRQARQQLAAQSALKSLPGIIRGGV